MQRWSPGFKQNVKNSRVKTTKALADSIQNTKAIVFATISGVAYYKPNDIIYTEESKCESYDFLSSRILLFICNIIFVCVFNYQFFQNFVTIGRKQQNYQKIAISDK